MLSESLGPFASLVTETTPMRALDLILTGARFDAVVCDVMMPGMSGIDLHERVALERPDIAARFVFFGVMQLVEATERVTGTQARS
jgi:CheY-like chemotaxis protein